MQKQHVIETYQRSTPVLILEIARYYQEQEVKTLTDLNLVIATQPEGSALNMCLINWWILPATVEYGTPEVSKTRKRSADAAVRESFTGHKHSLYYCHAMMQYLGFGDAFKQAIQEMGWDLTDIHP